MRSSIKSSHGRTRRLLATGLLLTLPFTVAACSDEDGDGVGTDDGPIGEIEEEDTDSN